MLIKIIFKDIVHRQQVDDPNNFTFEQLLTTVRNFTGIPNAFTVQYTDDEMESVTIGSTDELKDSFSIAERDGRTALRLFVVPTNSSGPLSVMTTASDSSAVLVNPLRANGEDSDFGDSDFEFVDDENGNNSGGNNEVMQVGVSAATSILQEPLPYELPGTVLSSDLFFNELSSLPLTVVKEEENVPSNSTPPISTINEEEIKEEEEEEEIKEMKNEEDEKEIKKINEIKKEEEIKVIQPIPVIITSNNNNDDNNVVVDAKDIKINESLNIDAIAEQVIRDVAENQMKQLYKALEVIFENESSFSDSDLDSVKLRKVLARVLSNHENVENIQKALSSDILRNVIVDIAKGEQESKNLWDVASPHAVSILDLMSNVLKTSPELFTIIPSIAAATWSLMQAQDRIKTNQQSSAAAININNNNNNCDDINVIHKRVQCNSCLELNPQLTEYISGPRFKSAVVEDFDLCKKCEENGKYRDTHGPFLKIYKPNQAPEAILCVLKDDGKKNVKGPKTKQSENFQQFWDDHHNEIKGNCFKEVEISEKQQNDNNNNFGCTRDINGRICTGTFTDAMESHAFAARRVAEEFADVIESELPINDGKSFAEFVNDLVQDTSSEAVAGATAKGCCSNKTKTAETTPIPVVIGEIASKNGCPGKHLLKRFVIPHVGYICDKCNCRPGDFAVMHGCRICDYDLCDNCYKHNNNPPVAVVTPIIGDNKKVLPIARVVESNNTTYVKQQQQQPIGPRPQAKFVADVSLPDGSVVSPGASVSKTWRLRNTGNIPWPNGSRIVHVGGDSLGLPAGGIPVEIVEPGHIVDVTVPLIAPSRPGRVVGYFRLMTPDNQRFGHRIWIDLNVDGSLGEQLAASVAEPFFKMGQNIVSRVQEETMRLYPRVPPNSINTTPVIVNVTPTTNTATSAASPSMNIDNVPDEKAVKYAIELTSLCDMGFNDLEKNIKFLDESNGDLELCIHLLMNEQ